MAVDEGMVLGGTEEKDLEACKAACTDSVGCNSFSFCDTGGTTHCTLKAKRLSTSDDFKDDNECTTYYQNCFDTPGNVGTLMHLNP